MLSPVLLTAGDLGIQFVRHADRYEHRVGTLEDGSFRLLAASREGLADADWPPSPPLQQLHIETRGEKNQVALLVGRAGRGHWSLSVEVDAARRALVFDVACRAGAVEGWLGSSYQVPADVTPARLDDGAIAFSNGVTLHISQGKADWEPTHHALMISPQATAARAGLQTYRWQYLMQAIPGR